MTDLAVRPNPFDEIWPCWHAGGWELASEWSVQDATRVTRAKARAAAAYDHYWVEIGVWKRYIRVLTMQERWEWWVEGTDEGWDGHPEVVPSGWYTDDEDCPTWEFVHRSHPEAWPVWIVGLAENGAPMKPMREASDAE